MEAENAFVAAVKGVSGVVQVAADASFDEDPNNVIPKVEQGVLGALRAAAGEPSVKRFVLTSSSVAAIIPETDKKGVRIDQNTWNDAVVDLAWSGTVPAGSKGYVIYSASKTRGERVAWEWIAEHKPQFVLNAVLPNCNFGTILVPDKMHGSTMGVARRLFQRDDFGFKAFPPQYFVDVRDDARLHVAALLDETVQNERIFAFAQEYNWTDVITILRKLRPNHTLPDPPAGEGRDYTEVAGQARALQLLQSFFGQSEWTGIEQSLAAGIEDIV